MDQLGVWKESYSPGVMLAQTPTTTVPELTRDEPARPLTEFVVDVLGLGEGGLTAGVLGLIIEPLLQIVLVVTIAWTFIHLARRVVRRMLRRMKAGRSDAGLGEGDGRVVSTRRSQRLDALGTIISSGIGFFVWTIAVMTILGSTFGLNIGPLLAGAGILGVALGFGAQDLVKDILSGLFMVAEDQYGVGDVIDVGEAIGVVEGLGLRTTRVRDVTGTLWHVPNGEIRRVGNMSQEWSRALLDIGVAYDTDVDAAAEVIKGVADTMAQEETYAGLFLAEPEIWGVQDLTADAVVVRLVVKTRPGEQWAISRELRRRIKHALDDASIEIPFPQRTVWMRDGDEPKQAPTHRDPHEPSAATGKAAAEEGASATAEEEPTQAE